MIIFKINVEGVFTLECKRDSQVAADRDAPLVGAIAVFRVNAIVVDSKY
ncbi:MAG TPA: hypothetical protein VES69_15240 [Pyrinomonadaceae bacterium]|nr:hypothetical protein [Pyrinomonadaceae bacterium]